MREALLKQNGVMSAEVDFASGQARVTYDASKLRPEQLPDALKGTGFSASLKQAARK